MFAHTPYSDDLCKFDVTKFRLLEKKSVLNRLEDVLEKSLIQHEENSIIKKNYNVLLSYL